ncbi:uncharacterized protein LALA0_S04e04038g [Lachancea lanzarotensis]|uniref:LALA0S04e04038g1_1 n=1 Tax=Lachancea lanzarotensis TaxID=1245769 RepID=A0A0C7N938_9SACH|nr:uncharacterized protein LALA0_S04e04038g [Lachancea lanzarotensis]CEP61937.1 LALA0S04e04038g1_1 [Lachancea lanzarotensis]
MSLETTVHMVLGLPLHRSKSSKKLPVHTSSSKQPFKTPSFYVVFLLNCREKDDISLCTMVSLHSWRRRSVERSTSKTCLVVRFIIIRAQTFVYRRVRRNEDIYVVKNTLMKGRRTSVRCPAELLQDVLMTYVANSSHRILDPASHIRGYTMRFGILFCRPENMRQFLWALIPSAIGAPFSSNLLLFLYSDAVIGTRDLHSHII